MIRLELLVAQVLVGRSPSVVVVQVLVGRHPSMVVVLVVVFCQRLRRLVQHPQLVLVMVMVLVMVSLHWSQHPQLAEEAVVAVEVVVAVVQLVVLLDTGPIPSAAPGTPLCGTAKMVRFGQNSPHALSNQNSRRLVIRCDLLAEWLDVCERTKHFILSHPKPR